MIDEITLHFGATPEVAPLSFQPGPMTVFVGPNNSGKSLTLEEIRETISEESGKIVDELSISELPGGYLEGLIYPEDDKDLQGLHGADRVRIRPRGLFGETRPRQRTQWNQAQDLLDQDELPPRYKRIAAKARTILLDGEKRLELVKPQSTGDLKGRPKNHLMGLFQDREARERVRELVWDAFGRYFVIDATGMNRFVVRLSDRPPEDVNEETGLDERARDFHSSAERIQDLSDGVKAYTGILSAVFSGTFECLLIDEPDAFLHPPLSRRLGQVLTDTANEREGNVFAATHDSNFLLGCVQSGKPVNIVRLTYQNEVATARLLPGDQLQDMMQDPLLRSANVLSSLFHQGTVVCEGDIDRAFYEEIDLRLRSSDEDVGMGNTLFINAISKQTVRKIAGPLREMGVPTAAIVDLDIIKKGDLSRLLRAAGVPQGLIDTWGQQKRAVLDAFDAIGEDPKAGLEVLSPEDRQTAENLVRNAAEFGIFIVPAGEVENWLPNLEVEGSKSRWIQNMFDAMGTNPEHDGYVTPTSGDVWDFVRRILGWLGNPDRKGMT
jgi:energy-coupling factor transporter ATP-binding protein EcfA2